MSNSLRLFFFPFAFLAFFNGVALAASEVKSPFEKTAEQVVACDLFLDRALAPVPKVVRTGVGWITLATPLSWALRDANKTKFLYETARSGVWINAAGALLGKIIAGHPERIAEIATNPWAGFISPYISYQAVNAARQGIALREGVSSRTKIVGNWVLTTYVYSMTDLALPVVMNQGLDPAKTAATFAMNAVWATFSELVRQYGTNPLFYHMFPKGSDLKKIESSHSTEEALADYERELLAVNRLIERSYQGEVFKEKSRKDLKDEALAIRSNIFWTKWLRKSKTNQEPTKEDIAGQVKRLEKIKNRAQIGVGVGLLSVYMMLKTVLLGTAQNPGYALDGFKAIFDSPVASTAQLEKQLPKVREAFDLAVWEGLSNPKDELFKQVEDQALLEFDQSLDPVEP